MFDKFTSLEHLHNSFLVAFKGRNKTKEVISYKQNLEENLLNLRKNLIDFTYKHRKYRTFIVEDSKKRVINAPSFEDHILHHAVFSFLEGIFDKKFIENSFANRKGKGSHKAVLKLQRESKKYNYFLKMDITKYFQSVEQEILFEQIKRHVNDEKFLYYVKIIIESYIETIILNPLTNKPTGMPIGNVTSQLFANIYLHDLDFYVENIVKPKYRKENRNIFYIRYVDDFVFLAEEKEDLIQIRNEILNFLQTDLKLSVSPKKLILNKIESWIPFLGYNILLNKLKIRNDTIRRFKKRIRNYEIEKQINSLISFKGHCDLANPKLISQLSRVILLNNINNIYKYSKQLFILYGSETRFRDKVQRQGSETRFRDKVQRQGSETRFRDKVQRQGSETRFRKMDRSSIFSKLVSSCFDVKTSNSNSFYQKKAISPVVATALLLVVAVVAVVGFQNWFQTYQSSMFSDIEIQSNQGANGLKIEGLIGDFLYVINNIQDNLSIGELKIGGNICTITNNLTLGMNEIPVSSCTSGLTTSTPDIVLITDKTIISKTVYLKNAGTTPSSSLSCPTGYIPVLGSSTYGTSDFCVMKYEAKNVGGIANSTASGTPWVSLTWQQAKTNCEALGADYHLITDNEWLTIAKNAETVASNWNSSVVGTGFMYLGHNDNNPANSLAADTNDSNGYYGTNDGVSSPGDNSYTNFPSNDARAYQGQKRTLTLQNGEVIWDLAGNVWEWVNDSMPIASRYHGGDQQWMSYSSDDGTGKIASLVPALKTPSSGWNANNGMGRYYDGSSLAGAYNSINEAPDFCTGYCSPTAVFLRGGFWYDGALAGAFALGLDGGPSVGSGADGGFRCSFAP